MIGGSFSAGDSKSPAELSTVVSISMGHLQMKSRSAVKSVLFCNF